MATVSSVEDNLGPSGCSLTERLRLECETREHGRLAPAAARSSLHQRLDPDRDDHRLPYQRDVDRIIHSKAYARYVDKTQVAYLIDNDHITHRGLHVQLVSNFARGIAEVLSLNVGLVEAISLGHDVGHPPFGHEGEGYLSLLSEEHGNGAFAHPWQSCRLFREIEPLNLGLSVYDGFLCHDGGMVDNVLRPVLGKTWDDHFRELEEKRSDPDGNIWPGTLEGCLVKLCDTMCYLGKDIEDAINMGILQRDEIPDTLLGRSNRSMLTVLAKSIISMSEGKDYIAVSEEIFEALKVIRRFNFEKIYTHPKLKGEASRVKQGYRVLFILLLDDLNSQKQRSGVWKLFAEGKPKRYLDSTSPVQLVVDYIAGMTDNFFVRSLERLTIPKRIELLSCDA